MLFQRPGRVAALASVTAVAALPLSAFAATVTNYRTDFQGAGWQYLWNAPSDWNLANTPHSTEFGDGPLTSIDDYEPLQQYTSGTTSYLSADGNATPDDAPARFLRMDRFNIQPGATAGAFYDGEENEHERYAIAAYTVDTTANYAIDASGLTLPAASTGLEVVVFIDPSNPIYTVDLPGGATSSFNGVIGTVNAGETIYIAFGTGGNATSDFASNVNFDINATPIPEPAAVGLGLGSLTLLMARRAR